MGLSISRSLFLLHSGVKGWTKQEILSRAMQILSPLISRDQEFSLSSLKSFVKDETPYLGPKAATKDGVNQFSCLSFSANVLQLQSQMAFHLIHVFLAEKRVTPFEVQAILVFSVGHP